MNLEWTEILLVLVKKDLEIMEHKARLAESARKNDAAEERIAKLEARVVELLSVKQPADITDPEHLEEMT